jgi:hypothetical protein
MIFFKRAAKWNNNILKHLQFNTQLIIKQMEHGALKNVNNCLNTNIYS